MAWVVQGAFIYVNGQLKFHFMPILGTKLLLLRFTMTGNRVEPVCIVSAICVQGEAALRNPLPAERSWEKCSRSEAFKLTHELKIIINKDHLEIE